MRINLVDKLWSLIISIAISVKELLNALHKFVFLFFFCLYFSFASHRLVFVPVKLEPAIFLHNEVFIAAFWTFPAALFVVVMVVSGLNNFLEFVNYSVANITVEFIIKYANQQVQLCLEMLANSLQLVHFLLLLDARNLGGDLVPVFLLLLSRQCFVILELVLPYLDLWLTLPEVLRQLCYFSASLLAIWLHLLVDGFYVQAVAITTWKTLFLNAILVMVDWLSHSKFLALYAIPLFVARRFACWSRWLSHLRCGLGELWSQKMATAVVIWVLA